MAKTTIKDYEHYKKLRKEKAIKKKWPPAKIAKKFDVDEVGWAQILAWMARYETERMHRKAAKK